MIDELPAVMGPVKLSAYRLPPMKNVGRNPDGTTIKHYRSEETALVVASWVARGASVNFICAMLNMRPGLLKELYHNELEHGVELADTMVAGKAFEMAMAGTPEMATMTKFWLERRHKGFKKKEEDKDGSIFNINIHV